MARSSAGARAALATVGLYSNTLGEWARILSEAERLPNDYGCFSRASWRAVCTDSWLDVGTIPSYHRSAAVLRAWNEPARGGRS
jgi:hypothetical protein